MNIQRGMAIPALFLIGLGVVFLVFNIVGWTLNVTWPILFFILAAGFYAPAVIWPSARQGLAALYIPGSILFVLGAIFTYNTATEDWVSWAYAWVLVPGGVGLGLWLASLVGGWGKEAMWVGLIMMVVCLVVFAFFGMLFGSAVLKVFSPILLILMGILLVWRSVRQSFLA